MGYFDLNFKSLSNTNYNFDQTLLKNGIPRSNLG